MKIFIAIFFSACVMLVNSDVVAQNKKINKITWSNIAQLPVIASMQKQLGVAGAFTGVSNNVLLIAGGANFADGAKPWQGGKKIHNDDVYVLKKEGVNTYTWLTPKTKHLKRKVAYGASVTTSQGIICAGGETENANSNKDVFMMRWNAINHDVDFKALPSLPIPVANACMTNIGKKIYLIGGETNGKPSNRAFVLDLSVANSQWQSLPDLPIAMSHSVAVTQMNGKNSCVYVIGGRSSTLSGISKLHNNTFCYDPADKKWHTLSSVNDGKVTTISAGTGVAIGANYILLAGGDKGDIFHQIETYNAGIEKATTGIEKEKLQAKKLALLTHHPGFSRDVLLFNTITNTWKKIDELPFYAHVTTTAVIWGNDIYIPSGEIKPGIRTPDIVKGNILNVIKFK